MIFATSSPHPSRKYCASASHDILWTYLSRVVDPLDSFHASGPYLFPATRVIELHMLLALVSGLSGAGAFDVGKLT